MLSTPENTRLCNEFARLTSARTLRDIFSLPGPVKIADIEQREQFDSFRPKGSFRLLLDNRGRQSGSDAISWSNLIEPFASSLEAREKTEAFENEYFHQESKDWVLQSSRELSKIKKGQLVHPDRESRPLTRVYLCANHQPTHIVGHADAIDIIDRRAPGFLDLDLPECKNDLRKIAEEFGNEFREAAKPLDPYTVNVITGATLHFRPSNLKAHRVLYHAFAL